MHHARKARALIQMLTLAATLGVLPAQAEDATLGATVSGLLEFARQQNPEYAAMRAEEQALSERIHSAGALPDPQFQMELRDLTRMGEQNPTLLPGRVGSTRYLLMQDLPWYGKRDLMREVATSDAAAAKGQRQGTWLELATRIKIAHVRMYYVHGSEELAQEILDLMRRLESIAQMRYAGGLAAQQDVIRAQVEQTTMRNELIMLERERLNLHAMLNALLARPAEAPLATPTQLRRVPALAQEDKTELERRVRANNPELFAQQARIRTAENMRELTYKNRYPDFTIGISPVQYENSIEEWELMVGLTLPLQQESRRAQEREAEAMVEAARWRQLDVANRLLAELADHLASIDAAHKTEDLLANSLLPQAELSFRAALAGYETGKVDFATLLDAQRQIRQTKQNQLMAQVETHMRLAEIERLLGEEL